MTKNQHLDEPSLPADRKRAGRRLRAARLLKRMPKLKDAADKLTIPSTTLWGIEQGLRSPNRTIFKNVSKILDVSTEFVLGRDPESDFEKQVSDLAEILGRPEYEDFGEESKKNLSERLRDLRGKAGFPNPTKAAEAFQWGRASYVNYEGFSKKMSADRAVFFALDLLDRIDERIEFGEAKEEDRSSLLEFLLGEKPKPPVAPDQAQAQSKDGAGDETETVTGQGAAKAQPAPVKSNDVKSASSVSMSMGAVPPPEPAPEPSRPSFVQPELRWLRSRVHERIAAISMLEISGRHLRPFEEPMVMPVAFLKGLEGNGRNLFAMPIDPSWKQIGIFERSVLPRSPTWVFDGRSARPWDSNRPIQQQLDPIDYAGEEVPVWLGSLVSMVEAYRP